MNITKIKVSLTGEDLLSIYSEFVSVEGLEVKDIKINDEISITGRLNKEFKIWILWGECNKSWDNKNKGIKYRGLKNY